MSSFLLLVPIRVGLHLVLIITVNSIANWADLEKKFHTYFYTGTGEKKITDLTTKYRLTNTGKLIDVAMSKRANMSRDTQFQKSTTVAKAYDPYSVDDDYKDEEEVVAVE